LQTFSYFDLLNIHIDRLFINPCLTLMSAFK